MECHGNIIFSVPLLYKHAGRKELSASTQMFSLSQQDFKCLPWDQSGSLLLMLPSSQPQTAFQSLGFQSSHCRDALLRFHPPHKLSLHTQTHTYTCLCLFKKSPGTHEGRLNYSVSLTVCPCALGHCASKLSCGFME